MARKKQETQESETKKVGSAAASFLKKFRETNKLASILTESKLSNINSYVSSGSYCLNKVISGSYFKGWPENRILCIGGESGAGKTYICLSTAREAQKAGYQVVYFDSENAVDAESARNVGVDTDTLLHIPVSTITEFRNQAIKFMREWREDPETKDIPLLMFLDSLGGLAGSKEMNDVEENKTASDMGQRAKEARAAARVLMMECAKNNVGMIVTNHTYEQQNMMGAPTIKFGGGEGFVYACSGLIIVQKKVVKEVEGKDSEGRVVTNRKGSIVVITSEKNRLVPAGTRGYMYIDFKKGLNPYYGLIDDATQHGFIEQAGAWYTLKDKDGNAIKKFQKADLYKSDTWEPILKDLNEKVEASMAYSKHGEEIEGDDTGGEVEEKDDE